MSARTVPAVSLDVMDRAGRPGATDDWCRWVTKPHGPHTYRVCAAPRLAGSSYCPRHAALAAKQRQIEALP